MKEKKRLCPILLASSAIKTIVGCECRENNCAWWTVDYDGNGKCAIVKK